MAMKIRLSELPSTMTVEQMLAAYTPFGMTAYLSLENASVDEWQDEPDEPGSDTLLCQQTTPVRLEKTPCEQEGCDAPPPGDTLTWISGRCFQHRTRHCPGDPKVCLMTPHAHAPHGFTVEEREREQKRLVDSLEAQRPAQELPVEVSPSTGDAQTGGLEPVTPASAGSWPKCPCGCGQDVVNKPKGRKRLYASDRCRHVYNDTQKRAKKHAAEMDLGTPVVVVAEPVGELAPACEKCHVVMFDPTTHECVLRPRRCARCESDMHYVEDCPQPLVKRKPKVKVEPAPSTPADSPPVEDASQRSVREAKERLAHQKVNKKAGGEARDVLTCARCQEKGHSIFSCPTPFSSPSKVVVPAVNTGTVTDDELTAHSNALLELCRDGLPGHFQYSFKEDVLALYGVDMDLLDAAVRNPERVEIRPESQEKGKRYCILALNRGDLQVILGMRSPSTPQVIAVYVNSRLEHDIHRVGHSGGGAGGAKAAGLPKTARQVATRLRAMGGRDLEVEIDPRQGKTTTVTYKGQDLGQISTEGDRTTSEQDYQRVQRKMAAIDRRQEASA